MIQVRDFRTPDQSVVRQMIEDGLGEHFGFIDSSLNPDLDDIFSNYIETGNRFFIAEEKDTILGCAALLLFSNHAKMVRVSTHAAHRRRGVATALLDRCKTVAISEGKAWLVAFTQPEWLDAVSYYKHHGFQEFGRDSEDVHLRLSLSRTS